MTAIMVIATLILRLCLCESSERRRGMIEEAVEKKKYICPLKTRQIFTAGSQMQCVNKCLHEDTCHLLNFAIGVLKNNCEIFSNDTATGACRLTATEEKWVAMHLKRFKAEDIKEDNSKDHNSCKEIYNDSETITASDGVYKLKSGRHFCSISPLGECGGGGWTLAISVNGSKETFKSDSQLWTNDVAYDTENGLKDPMNVEAKYPAFAKIAFDEICIGFKSGGVTKWALITKKSSSLHDIFKTNTYVQTSLSRSKWKTLINGASLQLGCNKEGFNVNKQSNELYARIGIICNSKTGRGNQCNKSCSYIGIGTKWGSNRDCSGTFQGVSSGNAACDSPDNGERSTPAFGLVFVK